MHWFGDVVPFRETFPEVLAMLIDGAEKIVSHADIKRAGNLAGVRSANQTAGRGPGICVLAVLVVAGRALCEPACAAGRAGARCQSPAGDARPDLEDGSGWRFDGRRSDFRRGFLDL